MLTKSDSTDMATVAMRKDPRAPVPVSAARPGSSASVAKGNLLSVFLAALAGMCAGAVLVIVLNNMLGSHAAPTDSEDADGLKAQIESNKKSIRALEDTLRQITGRMVKAENESQRQGYVLDEIKKFISEKR